MITLTTFEDFKDFLKVSFAFLDSLMDFLKDILKDLKDFINRYLYC